MKAEDQVNRSSRSLTLDLPPSCIEFCPAHPDHFIVGTYNLQTEEPAAADGGEIANSESSHDEKVKKLQSRNGSLVVFRLAENGDDM
jgi:diphthine methyl ester acylhydrolase